MNSPLDSYVALKWLGVENSTFSNFLWIGNLFKTINKGKPKNKHITKLFKKQKLDLFLKQYVFEKDELSYVAYKRNKYRNKSTYIGISKSSKI